MKLLNVCILLFLWVLSACNTTKNSTQPKRNSALQKHSPTTTTKKEDKNSRQILEKNEMPSFFDAEKERLGGNYRQSLNLYNDFLKKYPQNATALFNTARLQLQLGEENAAIKNAQKASELEPTNSYFRELYLKLLIYQNNYKEAEAQLNYLIEKNPFNDEYLYRKAMLFTKMKNYEKAITVYDEIEKKTGFNEDIALQKKALYQSLGKPNEAIAQLQKLKEQDPSAIQYLIMMIDVYEKANENKKTEELYSDLENKFDTEPIAQVALAQYYLKKNNTDKYEYYMKKVVENKNIDPETKISLMLPIIQKINLDSLQDNKQMIDFAQSITAASPESKDAKLFYANVLYYTKNYDQALIEYKKIIEKDGSNFEVWNNIISISFDNNQLDSVVYYSQKCIENFPNNPLPYFFKGIAYIQLKKYPEALKMLNNAADYEPDNKTLHAQIYSSLGEVYHQTKQYPQSDSCFNKSLAIEPEDATTLNNYAYYLSLRNENLQKAESMSKKSLKLQPDNKSFLDTYGWILFQQKKYPEAKEYIEKALHASGENDATLLEHLGDTYFKLNEPSKALDFWKKAAQISPNNLLLNKKITNQKWYEE